MVAMVAVVAGAVVVVVLPRPRGLARASGVHLALPMLLPLLSAVFCLLLLALVVFCLLLLAMVLV